MDKKICMITGANAGIGKAAAIQMAQQGHRTILACRNRQKGEAALREVQEKSRSDTVELMIVDMSLQSSIREFAQTFLSRHNRLDVLIHNAAIFDITQTEARYTIEGLETFWATNHLGPVLLTERLLPALQKSAQGRIITIATKGLVVKPFLKVDLADPQFKQKKFSPANAYYQSKLAQVTYTIWLANALQGTNITVNCIQVPAVRVDISKYVGLPFILKKIYAFKAKFALSPEQMATVYAYLATADELNNVTGKCFDEKLNRIKPPRNARQTKHIEAVMNLTMDYLNLL